MSTEKMIRDYSCPEASNILARSNPLVGIEGFELFMEVCSTFIVKGISQDAIRICLFSFSLVGKAKQWFYKGC